jgi:hypothetical protein
VLASYASIPGKAHVNATKKSSEVLVHYENLGTVYRRDIKDAESLGGKELVVYENDLHPNDMNKDKENALKTMLIQIMQWVILGSQS